MSTLTAIRPRCVNGRERRRRGGARAAAGLEMGEVGGGGFRKRIDWSTAGAFIAGDSFSRKLPCELAQTFTV